ncbi:MAG: Crp/Fnr family transcriptional regulator [Lautropia sp.]
MNPTEPKAKANPQPRPASPGAAPAPGTAPSPAAAATPNAWRKSLWTNGLTADQLARVERDLAFRECPGGTVILRKGEPVAEWIGVVEGLVKVSSVSPDGKSLTFAGVPSGGWFGEGSLLKRHARKYDAVALRDSVVALMPAATFGWLLDHSIAFNRFLLIQLNERLGQFIGTVEFERFLDPDARVARCIANLYNPHLYPGAAPLLELSQEEIGYLSGISRQRVNQALQTLERAGLLKLDYRSVTVLDVPGLASYQ